MPAEPTVPVSSTVLASLLTRTGLGDAVRREPVHVWSMSAVERVRLDGGRTVVLKSAVPVFASEAEVLRHAEAHGVPVPRVLVSAVLPDGRLAMLLEDLGEPAPDVPLGVGAAAAARVHACPPLAGRPCLDEAALASLPATALASLAELRRGGRWEGADDVRDGLEALADAAPSRARGALTPPFGMCHGEWHPTSVHRGRAGLRILDWARAFTGPGLLDLASWRDTPRPLDTEAVAAMIDAYVRAGGPRSAAAERGGLPPQAWAGGWHRVWIVEWFLRQAVRHIPDPGNDGAAQRAVRRHLAEALGCLG